MPKKIKKADVHWVRKVLVRNCQNCVHRKGRIVKFMGREYTEGHVCGLHGWRTLANAICDNWKGDDDGKVHEADGAD